EFENFRVALGRRRVFGERVGFARAVVVARPGHDQVVLLRHRRPALSGRGRGVAVPDLDTREPRIRKFSDPLVVEEPVGSASAGMRENGNPTRRDDEFDAGERLGGGVWTVVATTPMQDAAERGAAVGHMTAGDERV